MSIKTEHLVNSVSFECWLLKSISKFENNFNRFFFFLKIKKNEFLDHGFF